jgi:hypothetical protein
MAKKSTSKPRQTSRSGERAQEDPGGSGSGRPSMPKDHTSGSGSKKLDRCKYFAKDEVLPIGLTLQLDAPLKGGNEFGRQQLNRPALLIHAQDPAFACCWFSRAIDLGDEYGNPAFWMLQKTASDTWSLFLRRVSGEIAAYHLQSKIKHFPIQLKKDKTTKDFEWPSTITISHSG